MSTAIHLTNRLARSLVLVSSFSLFVLAAISIRWGRTVFSRYFKVDPAAIVLGILAFLYFLFITVAKSLRSSALKAKTVLTVSTIFTIFFLGVAISYSVLRRHGIYTCVDAANSSTNIFWACRGLIHALIAISWIGFVFCATYLVTLFLLAKEHSTLPWTNRENGMDVPIGYLNPVEPTQSQMVDRH